MFWFKLFIKVLPVLVALCFITYIVCDISSVGNDFISVEDTETRNRGSKSKFYQDFFQVYFGSESPASDDDDGNGNIIDPSPEPNPGPTPSPTEGLARSFTDFCKASVSASKGNNTSVKVDGVELYDGLPWDKNNAYELDLDVASKYVNIVLNTDITSYSIDIDNACTARVDVEGVRCASFCGYPIQALLDVNEYGIPVGWSASTRPRKVCAVLRSKSDGKLYYLPVTCQKGKGFDAKGHIWPGGVLQTYLRGTYSSNGWHFDDDGGFIKGMIINKYIKDLNEIGQGYSTVTYNGSKVTPRLSLEVSSSMQRALKGYELITFIAWKG